MANCPQMRTWLTEAEQAYHDINTGKHAIRYVDQNGEQVEYARASLPKLAQYIQRLRDQIANECDGGTQNRSTRGPLGVCF